MSYSISIQLTEEARAALARVEALPEVLAQSLKRGLDAANNRALGTLAPAHFMGAGPFPIGEHRLGQRTGHLEETLRVSAAIVIDQRTVIGSLGTSVNYLAPHEFGFSGQVYVKEHLRRVTIHRLEGRRISEGDISRLGLRTKAGKPRKAVSTEKSEVTVHAFTRWMQTPERAPLRTGIEENLPMYRETLSAAIMEGMKG